MKVQILFLAAMLAVSGVAMAHGDDAQGDSTKVLGTGLCARWVAYAGVPDQDAGYPVVSPGPYIPSTTGYGETAEAASSYALQGCKNEGGGEACQILSLTHFHGLKHVFSYMKCQDQWPAGQ